MTKKQSLVSSNKQQVARRRVAIHGKPGAGKTTAAMSLVEEVTPLLRRFTMPADEVRKQKWESVNALWVSADTNATEGARARRLEVPGINLAAIFDALSAKDLGVPEDELLAGLKKSAGIEIDKLPNDVLDALEWVTDEAHAFVSNEKPQVVCVDTASAMDKPILRYWENNAPRTKSGARDSFAIWRSMIATHERFHANMNALPCDVVFLMHSKPRSESESAEKKARAQNVAGQLSDIRFDFMYEDCANIYRRHMDLILIADKLKQGQGFEYALFNNEHDGFEAKSRYSGLIPDKLPVDLFGTYQQYIEANDNDASPREVKKAAKAINKGK